MKSLLKRLHKITSVASEYDPRKLSASVRSLGDDSIICLWEDRGQNRDNWGDALNPHLVHLLSGKKVVQARSIFNVRNKPVYSVIGSTLHSQINRQAGNNLEIWGAGLISEDSSVRTRPRKIHAVRGPHTRAKLLSVGISCPDVYGDPAILYPLFYRPTVEDRYEIGIIPHYADLESPELERFANNEQITIINIRLGIRELVDQVTRCGLIVSSSLHGIIIAESYGIPAVWVRISDRLVGGDFKFLDYYASTERPNAQSLNLSDVSSPNEFASAIPSDRPRIDLVALLRSCPFLNSDLDLVERCRSHPMFSPSDQEQA